MTPDSAIHFRTAVKALMVEDYISFDSYRLIGDIWHISSATAWRLINRKNYWPSSWKIRRILREKAKERGIEIVSRKRNRVELDLGISKEDLQAIRELTTAERTKALIDFIRGE